MNGNRSALLLVGSGKREPSNSEALGRYLLERMEEQGWDTETLHIQRSLAEDSEMRKVVDGANRTNLLILSFPLHWDSLPAAVIRALEIIDSHRNEAGTPTGQRIMAISNCGFPEARQNATALENCRLFSRDAGFQWAGGLALGGGESLGGKSLPSLGGRTRNIRKALDLTALALDCGEPVPAKAVKLMGKKLYPTWAYLFFGNWGWKRRARKYGAQDRLWERPHQQ